MGRRQDRPGDPFEPSWLDELTGEIDRVPPPAPPRPAPPPAGQRPAPPGAYHQPYADPYADPYAQPPEDPYAAGPPPPTRAELREAGRAERRRNRRRRVRGIVVFLVLVSVVLGVTWQAYRFTTGRSPSVAPGLPVTLTVEPGASSQDIGEALEDKGVVDSAGRFRAVASERGVDGVLKPGTYELETGMGVDAVLDVMVKGPAASGKGFTIPEGYTVGQIVDRIAATRRFSKAQLNKALTSKELRVPFRPKGEARLEGLLFPQTYRIQDDDTPVTVLQGMLDQLETVMTKYDLGAAPRKLSPYQVLVVASMIEREAKVPEDRSKIARVIYNRLGKGMRLQIDATVQYALGTSKQKLSNQDLTVRSPYNTYRVGGLPPTPIASPGEASIRAALEPADGPWLYYVLIDKQGRHAFTDSDEEFARLKEQARAKGLL